MRLMLQIVGRQTQTYFSYLLVVVDYYYYYYYSGIHKNVSKLLRTNERWLAWAKGDQYAKAMVGVQPFLPIQQ